jgi:hypothetical protein
MQPCRRLNHLIFFLFAGIFNGCDFQKDIEIKLPPYEKQLVAECYLEREKGLRVILTETNSYFDSLRFPFINNAKIILSNNLGLSDTIRYNPSIDLETLKFYNYNSSTFFYDTSGNYNIEIIDSLGRKLKGQTRFLPPPDVDTIMVQFDPEDSSLARFQIYINDFPDQSNYYRVILNEDSLNSGPVLEFEFTDQNLDGRRFPIGTTYRFKRGKTMLIRIYHIEQQYYNFLESMEDAARANGNPFAQPATILSPMNGGFGIFTTLNYRFYKVKY